MNSYLEEPEEHFGWFEGIEPFRTLLGGRAHGLTVTSLQWLNDTEYKVKNGSSIWTHEVVVVNPIENKHPDKAVLIFAANSG